MKPHVLTVFITLTALALAVYFFTHDNDFFGHFYIGVWLICLAIYTAKSTPPAS